MVAPVIDGPHPFIEVPYSPWVERSFLLLFVTVVMAYVSISL
jgi:hypothetical protein